MRNLRSDSSLKNLIITGSIQIAAILILFSAKFISNANDDQILQALILFIFAGLSLVILRRPYIGVVVTVASQPIVSLVPSISNIGSIITIVGLLTMGSYLLTEARKRVSSHEKTPKVLIIGLLFLLWITISNPLAALAPGDEDRIWILTFTQLWILVWLAYKLLDSPEKIRVLMWGFSIAAIASAFYAIPQGAVGDDIYESVRGSGLTGGANSAARYFLIALAFMYYLRSVSKNSLIRLLILIGMGILFYGTLATVSRTGLLLLVGLVGMIFTIRMGSKRRIQSIVVFLLVLILVWFVADNVLPIMGTIVPSVVEGTDTVGLRYKLWQAGLQMWSDHILQGVGIGQYSTQLGIYGQDLLPPNKRSIGAHNMYVQILAETGFVGLVLFLSILILPLLSLWKKGGKIERGIQLTQIWLIAYTLLLLGGITKHDHYDKLLWLMMGVSLALSHFQGINISKEE